MTKPKLPVGIDQLPSDRYRARYRNQRGKMVSKTFTRLTDAKGWRSQGVAAVERHEWEDPKRKRVPFAEVADRWAQTRQDLRPNTFAQHEVALRVHLLPRFGECAIGDVDFDEIERFQADLLAADLARSTVSKYREILGQILDYALRAGYIKSNPVKLVRGPGQAAVRKATFLSPHEVNELADAASPRFRAMILLAAWRGFRFGECAGLKVEKVSLVARTITVDEILVEVGGQHHFGPPKTKREHPEVHLPGFLVDALAQHQDDHPPKDGMVFTAEDGSLLRRSNFARREFKPAVKRSGVDERLTFHGLRHTAASLLISEGAQITEVAAILGWSKSTMVQMAGRYAHLLESRDKELTERLEQTYRDARATPRADAEVRTLQG